MIVVSLLVCIFLLGSCEANNKQDLDGTLFKDGETLVQAYYESANGSDKSKEIQTLAPKFDEWEKNETFSSEDEILFIRNIQSLKQGYQLYKMEYILEYASKNTQGDKKGAKEEMMKRMKELQDNFGVVYDKK